MPAAGKNDPCRRLGQVGDEILAVVDLRADGDVDLDVLARGPVLAGAAAVAAFFGCDPLPPLQRGEVAQVRVGDRQTSPPSPPSPPSGPPFGTYFSRRNDSPPSPPRPAFT